MSKRKIYHFRNGKPSEIANEFTARTMQADYFAVKKGKYKVGSPVKVALHEFPKIKEKAVVFETSGGIPTKVKFIDSDKPGFTLHCFSFTSHLVKWDTVNFFSRKHGGSLVLITQKAIHLFN
jgi:saccharopine dehydrogenase-like NADP-dependent oxidoreductase